MKEILIGIINRLFDTIPFSKMEEELKEQVSENVLLQYKNEYESDEEVKGILKGAKLIGNCESIGEICEAANVNPDISEYLDEDEIKTGKDGFRAVKKAKKYIYCESVCIVIVLQAIVSTIFHFSWLSLIINLIGICIFSGAFYWINTKKKKFLLSENFENLKYDISGREYFKKQSDKYSKKFLNTWMIVFAAFAYIIFAVIFSVVSSRYSFKEVAEQLSYLSLILEVVLYIHIKNFFCRNLVNTYFTQKRQKEYMRQIIHVSIASCLYFVAVILGLCLFRNKIENVINWMVGMGAIYFVGCLVYNLTVRKNITFKNIIVNPKKVTAFSLIIVLLITYKMMSADFYFTQGYINKVSKTQNQQDNISYNEDNGVYTITTAKSDYKVLQLTDIHMGGSALSAAKDLKALEACNTLIDYTKPDFVVVTGDLVFPMGVMSFSLNNSAPIMQFANFMRNKGIPWAFTYGNHDTESMATLNVTGFQEMMKSLSFKSSGNLLYPYVQPDIYGRSNQMIEVRNTDGSLMQALFLIDSNDYIQGVAKLNEYDYIHDDQVEWYKKNVLALSEKEGYTIPSMLFFHIPLQEYKTANDLYESGSNEVKYFYGIIGETMIDKICASNYSSKLFDTAVELKSTKAMFCGHDHYNNQSLEYKGIRLSYGYSIDYLAMPGIDEKEEQRGATLITINRNGAFEINPYRLMDIK